MADKSAFVPVDALAGHKTTDLDVDMDAELFGAVAKQDSKTGAAAPTPAVPIPIAPVPAVPVATPTLPPPPALEPTPVTPVAKPKFQYKKATTFIKTYAGQKK